MKLIIAILIISIIIALCYHKFNEITRPLPVPVLDVNTYWGSGSNAKHQDDKTIKTFVLKTNKQQIVDLRQQLNRTFKFTEPLEGVRFEYGFNTDALKPIIEYWRDDYLPRWAERETYLNSLPQYTTEIQGLRIHYIHAKPSPAVAKKKKVIPLLLLHGWPGSVREFYNFIPLLTNPPANNEYAFEVIAPSLVGFGWSQAAPKPGFNAAEMAIVMRNLMLRIGHEHFLVQGGDWGSIIGGILSTLFPQNVIGYHSNMCIINTPLSFFKHIVANYYPEKFVPSPSLQNFHFPLSDKLKFLLQESGYFHLQATKPDTIGTALAQNPISLAVYILEKFQLASGLNQEFDCITKTYQLDGILDNLMIYYLTGTATSAARFYAENMSRKYRELQLDRVPSEVPMGCARFKNDLTTVFDWQLKDKFPNLIHSKYFKKGGHFAALEVPVVLYSDFIEFVTKIKFN